MDRSGWLVAAACCVQFACVAAHAQDGDAAAATLTGDWGGLRTRAADAGLVVEAGFKADAVRARGGVRDGGQTMWQLDARIAADLGKLAGWDGWSAYLQVLNDRGGRINGRNAGSLMGISNLEVDPAATRVFQAWLQKSFDDGRFAALVGLYPVDTEFATLDNAVMFSHPSFGPPADFSLTRGPSIFPIAAFGARLRAQSGDGSRYLMGALLDGVPGHPTQRKGTHVRFHRGEGAFGIVEAGWKPSAKDGEAAGKFALGAWAYTSRVGDLVDLDAQGDPARRRSRGGYVLAERDLWRLDGDDRVIAGFVRYSATDGDSTPIQAALNVGVRVTGPIAARPADQLGIGFTRAKTGAKFRQAQADAGIAAERFEDALEVGYRVAPARWLIVQPLVQRIRNPGAHAAVRDATVVGVRIEVAL